MINGQMRISLTQLPRKLMVLFDEQMEHNGEIITIFFGGAMVMAAVSVPPITALIKA